MRTLLPRRPARLAALVAVAAALLAAGCAPAATSAEGATDQGPAEAVRLGYFATVTHTPALVGVAEGLLADALGETDLATQVFGAGPAAIEAMNAGAIDAAFIGPNPAINGFLASDGEALRIVAGSTSGGAQFAVRAGLTGPEDLVGTTLSTPQLGGTQDVALRSWLADAGLEATLRGDGDVRITPTENAVTLQLFRDGVIDGAWVPEPWASRLVLEEGAEVLVDERDLWPDGRFPTTHLVVSARFLAEHPETVEALIAGTVDAIAWARENPDEAATVVNAEIDRLTGRPLRADVLERALGAVDLTPDPMAGALATLLQDGRRVGTAPAGSLEGIYDLRLLNRVLAARGEATVDAAGLGLE